MSDSEPAKVRVKRTVYNVVYEDGSKLETVDPLEIRKSGKVIKRISHKTIFYVCKFSEFRKVSHIERNKPTTAAKTAHAQKVQKEV